MEATLIPKMDVLDNNVCRPICHHDIDQMEYTKIPLGRIGRKKMTLWLPIFVLIFLQCLVKSRQTLKFVCAGNTKGGSITVQLTSCLTGLKSAVWLLTIFVFICKTDSSKPVKQEVNGTVIRPPVVFPGVCFAACRPKSPKEGIFQMKIYGDFVPVL